MGKVIRKVHQYVYVTCLLVFFPLSIFIAILFHGRLVTLLLLSLYHLVALSKNKIKLRGPNNRKCFTNNENLRNNNNTNNKIRKASTIV